MHNGALLPPKSNTKVGKNSQKLGKADLLRYNTELNTDQELEDLISEVNLLSSNKNQNDSLSKLSNASENSFNSSKQSSRRQLQRVITK